jgi:hypothetical protein
MTEEKPTTLEFLIPKATKAVCGKRTWVRNSTRSLWHPEKPKGSVPIDTKTLIVRIRQECNNNWKAGVWLHFDTLDKQAVLLTEGSVL